MTVCLYCTASDWRTTPTSSTESNINHTVSTSGIVKWLGVALLTATASDVDYYSNDNWSTYSTSKDTLTYSWNTGGMGTPGNPTGFYTGVPNIQNPGEYTITSIVTDTGTVVSPNTGNRHEGPHSATATCVVVRADVYTSLSDTGQSNDPENTLPGKTITIFPDNPTLLAVPISYTPNSSLLDGCVVRLLGSGGIRVWADENRNVPIQITGMPPSGDGSNTWTINSSGGSTMPGTVYVEGSATGSATLELVFYRVMSGTEYEITRDAVKFTIVDNTPPTISIAKPAVDYEYVTGTAFIKAYITDTSGISTAKVYVDGTYKGNMTYENDYWRYDWNTTGTTKGNHTIRIDAQDASTSHNQSSATRYVYCHPVVSLDQISFQDDHTLWEPDADIEIQEPQWAVTGPIRRPFAYTVGSQMTANVKLISDDVNGSANIRYTVNGSWKKTGGTVVDTYSADINTSGSFPCWLAHYPTALDKVMDYTMDQSYSIYVRKSSNSDWCNAGSANVTHPQVYLTFGEPIGPWGTPITPRACWYNVLKYACEWMEESGYPNTDAGQLNARKRLAYKGYWSSGKYYSSSSHCLIGDSIFWMSGFLDDNWADCRDMSAFWVKLCNSVGLDARVRRIDEASEPDEFLTKSISLIGNQGWGPLTWNFHQVGDNSTVFDPCIQLDYGNARVAQDEDINVEYKNSLYDSGDWNLQNAFSLTEVY